MLTQTTVSIIMLYVSCIMFVVSLCIVGVLVTFSFVVKKLARAFECVDVLCLSQYYAFCDGMIISK